MSIISGEELEGLVEEMIDREAQSQMCGLELTLQKVERFTSGGSLAFHNNDRVLPQTEPLDFDSDGWISLPPGTPPGS